MVSWKEGQGNNYSSPTSSCFPVACLFFIAWAEGRGQGRPSVEQSGLEDMEQGAGGRLGTSSIPPLWGLWHLGLIQSCRLPELVLVLFQHGEENVLGGVWVGGERRIGFGRKCEQLPGLSGSFHHSFGAH